MILDANSEPNCIGLITWMHTFSPAKMWIAGLKALNKPFLHLHTQFNREIPWSTIDMDFMNTNQSAHGGREFGFICSRMRLPRKVVVGHWEDAACIAKLASGLAPRPPGTTLRRPSSPASATTCARSPVTEGDKVAAQLQFGYSVNGYGLGDVVAYVEEASESTSTRLCGEYDETYQMASPLRSRRRATRVAPRCGPDRVGTAGVSGVGRVCRLHRHL